CDGNAIRRHESFDVRDETGQDGHVPDPLARPARTEAAEFARGPRVPHIDLTRQPSAWGDDLALLLDQPAVELDLPQLVAEPDREVTEAAGVDPLEAGLHAAGVDPLADSPAKA